MARIEVTADSVRVNLSLPDKIWAVHGSLAIPIEHIIDASVADENGWDHLWKKIIGTNAPGLKMAGTFVLDGGLAFLDYAGGRQCVVLETQHETYRTVIVQTDHDQDPHAIAAQILARIGRHA